MSVPIALYIVLYPFRAILVPTVDGLALLSGDYSSTYEFSLNEIIISLLYSTCLSLSAFCIRHAL